MNKVLKGMRRVGVKLFAIVAMAVVFTACASSGPATQYYSLFANSEITPVGFGQKAVSIGVGPVVLPEYMDNPSVVSLTNSQTVRVMGYHAWAGDLKASIHRVIADDLSRALELDTVWAFPWDSRVRPAYQIRIVFDNFSGVRGESATLGATWSVLHQRDETLIVKKTRLQAALKDDSVEAYVAGLNQLLNGLSAEIAQELSNTLSK